MNIISAKVINCNTHEDDANQLEEDVEVKELVAINIDETPRCRRLG